MSTQPTDNPGLPGYATEHDAAQVMPDIEALEQQQANEGKTARVRDDQGRFKKTSEQAVQDDAGDANAAQSDQEGSGEGSEAQGQTDDRHDEETLYLEIPSETEGVEPERLEVDTVLEGYRKSEALAKEVEELRSKPAIPPQEWDSQIMDAVNRGVQYEKTLEQIQQFIMPRQPDDQLLNPHSHQHDPDAYWAQKQEYDERLQQFQTLQQERERVSAENERQSKALLAAKMEREQAKLHEFWPEIKQETVAQAVRDDLSSIYGVDDQTLDSIVDHRFYALAKDALAYRKQEAAAKNAAKVVRSKPAKVIRGKARVAQPSRARNAMDAFHSNPSEESADAALGAYLENLKD